MRVVRFISPDRTRDSAPTSGHHRHRMSSRLEPAQKELHLIMDHSVIGHRLVELLLRSTFGRSPRTATGSTYPGSRTASRVFDRVAAIQQLAFVAVDVGDRRVAWPPSKEIRVVRELARFRVKADGCRSLRGRSCLCKSAARARSSSKMSAWLSVLEGRAHVSVRD